MELLRSGLARYASTGRTNVSVERSFSRSVFRRAQCGNRLNSICFPVLLVNDYRTAVNLPFRSQLQRPTAETSAVSSVGLEQNQTTRLVALTVCTALLMATPLVPGEAVRDGQGILIIAGWFVVFGCWVGAGFLHSRMRIRWRWIDTAVLLFFVTLSISAVMVRGEGNVRYAINTMWSWSSMGVLYLGLRQWVCSPKAMRAVCAAMLAVSASLSVHGLHQYFVKLPELRRSYEADKRSVLDEVGIHESLNSAVVREFEDRLRSKEPLATFALTNSLAGFLTPWLVIAMALLVGGFRGRRPWLHTIVTAAALIAVLCCLVLTKSRAAYVACGMAVCLLALVIGQHRKRVTWHRALLGCGVLGAIVSGAIVTRGLDWRVVTESVKTLQYRLEYWEATLGVISSRPVWGCGPGNFQQHYAAHKLPQASETIADPHNFLLEVWAISGTVGLVSLAVVGVSLGAMWWHHIKVPQPAAAVDDSSRTGPVWWVYAGCALMPLVVFAASVLFGSLPDPSLLWIGMPVGALVLVFQYPWIQRGNLDLKWIGIAGFALLLNLLVSGGIGFSGVAQSAWVLLAFVVNQLDVRLPWELGRKRQLAMSLVVLFVGGLFWQSMYRPVTQFQPFMLAAEYHRQKGNQQLAIRSLRRAAQIDPASVLPWRLLASLYQRTKDGKAMEYAIEQTLRRDPQSHALHQQMAELWLRDGRPKRAVPLLQTAVKLYPASGINHAQLAWVCQLAGNMMTAQNHAAIAIQLDALNPHIEQKLEHQALIGLRGRRVDDARAMMNRLRKPPVQDSSFRARGDSGRRVRQARVFPLLQFSLSGMLRVFAIAPGDSADLEDWRGKLLTGSSPLATNYVPIYNEMRFFSVWELI